MDGREDNQSCRALLQYGASGEQLEGERERVQEEENSDFGATCDKIMSFEKGERVCVKE